MILLIDNIDSFVHNLERYFVRLGQETKLVRAKAVSFDDIRQWNPDAIVFSPGPAAPMDCCPAVAMIREFWTSIPMLGVCLGHQQIVHALGGTIQRAEQPVHGRASAIYHDDVREFSDLPNPLTAGRYHSLDSDPDVPAALEVSARTESGSVMAIRAKDRPVFGWQFHPESILTPHGFDLLRGFLAATGINATAERVPPERPLNETEDRRRSTGVHSHPITF